MDVLKTILYFSIFRHPLSKDEIFSFSKLPTIYEVESQLADLENRGIISLCDNYYVFEQDYESVQRRKEGYRLAQSVMPKAKKYANLIYRFPYVKGVFISGSLSKGYFNKNADFDYFIITKPRRLWLARMQLVIYKRLFLGNSHKYFCINYFITSDHLGISEQNRFTATELFTLIPVIGIDLYIELLNKNQWAKEIFPNHSARNINNEVSLKKPFFTVLIEKMFDNPIGDYLDDLFNKIMLNRWKRLYGHLDEKDFNIAMKSTKQVSKCHSNNYQKKIIELLNQRLEETVGKYKLHDLKVGLKE